MKKLYLSLVIIALITVACGSDAVIAPTPVPPPTPDCQLHNTATIVFGNTSLNSTYTVRLDGFTLTTLAPGQNSQVYTEAAGSTHTVQFLFSNTSLLACNTATPSWAQCSNNTLTCKF